MEHFRPHWPAPLIAVAGAIAGAGLFAWQSHGIELVGAIPSGFPSITLPDLKLAQQLWPGAVGIALMSFTETIAAGRAFVAADEPIAAPQYGAVGDRTRERRRRVPRLDAGRWRHVADRGQPDDRCDERRSRVSSPR